MMGRYRMPTTAIPSPADLTTTHRYRTDLTPSGATVVFLTGHVRFPGALGLRGQLCSLIESGATRVVVDLSRVAGIDSTGIGALVSGWKAAHSAGGELCLAAPSAIVVDVLDMLHLSKILLSHASAEDAFPQRSSM